MPKFKDLPIGAKFRRHEGNWPTVWVKVSPGHVKSAESTTEYTLYENPEYQCFYPPNPVFGDLPIGARFVGGYKVDATTAAGAGYHFVLCPNAPVTPLEDRPAAPTVRRVKVATSSLQPGDTCFNATGDTLTVVRDGEAKRVLLSNIVYHDTYVYVDQPAKRLSDCKAGDRVVVVDSEFVTEDK